MNRDTSYALVGAFVIALSLALVAAVLWLAVGEPGISYNTYHADMDESVSGLTIDQPVKYRGMDVGRVVGIDLDPEDPQQIRLTLEIAEGTPVTTATEAILEYQGITGVAYVNLQGGADGATPLLPTDEVPIPEITTAPSLLVRLDQGFSRLVKSLTETSDRVQTLLDEDNRASIDRTIADVESLVSQLEASSADLDRAIRNAADTFEGTRDLGGEARIAMQDIRMAAQRFEAMSADLERTSQTMRSAVEEGQTEALNLVGSTEREIRVLSTDLQVLAERLGRLAESLERDPSRVLFGEERPQPGPGEDR